jgi:2,3-dihydroxyphenylpropionate 1,2-dioxygenase
MLGERKPDLVSLDPSWHHNYATLAWWKQPGRKENAFEPHYPSIAPNRLDLTVVLHKLANDTTERDRYTADRKAYVNALKLTKIEKNALLNLKDEKMAKLGVHPFLSFMARLHIEGATKKS